MSRESIFSSRTLPSHLGTCARHYINELHEFLYLLMPGQSKLMPGSNTWVCLGLAMFLNVYGVKYMCGTEDVLIIIKIMKIHLITTKITLI